MNVRGRGGHLQQFMLFVRVNQRTGLLQLIRPQGADRKSMTRKNVRRSNIVLFQLSHGLIGENADATQ